MEKYEILIESVTGEKVALKGQGQSCVLLIVEGLQANEMVHKFSIYCNGQKSHPDQFSLVASKFKKWQ